MYPIPGRHTRLARPLLAACPRAVSRTLRLAPLALLCTLAHGQPRPQGLEPVLITATRSPLPLSQVLADATVLTRADIERQAIGSLADLLRSQACFEMVRNGGPGGNTSLFVRGADTRHTTVLIDGVRVDSQASSGASWQAIPLAQIERVEIVRGAASAIYGSDAIGGVVQIFTRKGQGRPSVELAAGAGNRGLAKLDASVSGAQGRFDYALSAAGERSEGFNTRPSSDPAYRPDQDGYRNRNASLRLGAQLSNTQRLELMSVYGHVNSQYDATAKPTVDDRNLHTMRANRASWQAQWSEALNTELTVGESFDRYETRPSPYQTETRIRAYTFNSGYKLSASTQLTAQLERREDRLENSGLSQAPTPGQAKRHQDALGAGLLWSAGPASLQLHARHDRDSQFGSASTGTVAAGYSLGSAWRLQAQLGSAFRAPSLYQQFSDYGVAGLQPERGRNAELGLHWSQGSSSAGISAYRNEIRDLIIFGAAGACLSQFGCYENVNKGLLQGLSLRGATRIATLRLSGSLDLQSPKDATPGSVSYGKLLARRSKTHLNLRADTELGAWSLGAQLLASAKRYDNAANTARLGGYATLDLEAQRSLGSDLRLQIKLDNAFDREYQTARGYASAPRQLFVGLRYTL